MNSSIPSASSSIPSASSSIPSASSSIPSASVASAVSSAAQARALLSSLLDARARESRGLKGLLRATWVRPMAEEQRHLARLRRRITDLCFLRAQLRGRFHLDRAPREGHAEGHHEGHHEGVWDRAAWHAEVAARVARELGLPWPMEAAGAAPLATEGGAA